MRRFRFRLQSILDLRRHEEDQRRLELGAASSRCAAISRRINERRSLRYSVLSERSETISRDDIAWRRAVEAYALRLEYEIQRLEEDLVAAEQDREAARERFREAKRKADVLERLRERRESVHRDREKREEHLRLDEVSRYIHARGGR